MKRESGKRHLLLVVVLVAVVVSLWPKCARPAGHVDPKVEGVWSELDGEYAESTGYEGTAIKLSRGRYEETYFSCTEHGVSSVGRFRLEGEELVLTDSDGGSEKRLRVQKDRLIVGQGESGYALVKHVDSHGRNIVEANIFRGDGGP